MMEIVGLHGESVCLYCGILCYMMESIRLCGGVLGYMVGWLHGRDLALISGCMRT